MQVVVHRRPRCGRPDWANPPSQIRQCPVGRLINGVRRYEFQTNCSPSGKSEEQGEGREEWGNRRPNYYESNILLLLKRFFVPSQKDVSSSFAPKTQLGIFFCNQMTKAFKLPFGCEEARHWAKSV